MNIQHDFHEVAKRQKPDTTRPAGLAVLDGVRLVCVICGEVLDVYEDGNISTIMHGIDTLHDDRPRNTTDGR